MRIITIAMLFQFFLPLHSAGNNFNSHWYDGNAEISTYAINEMRYGQLREGKRVMVFVTEPMRLSTHIKPDAKLKNSEKIKVLKLNDLRKFNTGIYDYSVMTSVFSAVEEKENVPLFGTMKVSFSSQEWCGNVFERIIRADDYYEGILLSYFESEGELEYEIEHKNRVESEENLWIYVRELKGVQMVSGESKPISILPSKWSRRKSHSKPQVVEGVLHKGAVEELDTPLGIIESVKWTWELNGDKTTVHVEKNWPRKIVSWAEPDGSKGTILSTTREPYWEKHRNEDLHLRDKLKI